mmetsp:Transcript_19843/g.25553  ORF Transcript_19843/g.25553 Transcript_19843/m.25553 type:complete len:81 (+) Transcript_19843:174-416(+)
MIVLHELIHARIATSGILDITVVFITSTSTTASARKALAHVMGNGFIDPFSGTVLLEALWDLMNNKPFTGASSGTTISLS